jgi:hypothetical protein
VVIAVGVTALVLAVLYPSFGVSLIVVLAAEAAISRARASRG